MLSLLEYPTVSGAAKSAGVNPSTIYRYLQDETFARELRRRRGELFTTSVGLLVKASAIATKTLVEMMLDTGTPATARVSACRAVLEHSRASQDLDVLSFDAQKLADELEAEKNGYEH